jgi:hypothetical protein
MRIQASLYITAAHRFPVDVFRAISTPDTLANTRGMYPDRHARKCNLYYTAIIFDYAILLCYITL